MDYKHKLNKVKGPVKNSKIISDPISNGVDVLTIKNHSIVPKKICSYLCQLQSALLVVNECVMYVLWASYSKNY